MADQRFFNKKGPFTVGDLAQLAQATLSSEANEQGIVSDTASLDVAKEGEIACFHNTAYRRDLETTQASVIILHPDHAEKAPKTATLLLSPQPYRSFARIVSAFYPPVSENRCYPGVCPSAYVDASAKIAEGVSIAPFVVINAGVEIGAGTRIGPHCVIEAGVVIGEGCSLDSHISVSHALIGNRVHIKPGARIGQSGFGFYMDEKGHVPIPQVGRVIIQDDVEIGANTTIDRGAGPDTIIGRGTRIDNLVQLGHNVQTGVHCVIVAQVGISGSTKLGNFVALGGQAGVAGHLTLEDGAKIAAQSGVMRHIKSKEIVAGCPAIPIKDWHRQSVTLSRLIKRPQ